MQQVPTYLIIGDGRLAKHLSFYFDSLNISYLNWSRNSGLNLEELTKNSSHILIAISDQAIANFVEENDYLKSKILIHFSGATHVEGVHTFHPLMTFTNELYDKDFYPTIPFINFTNDLNFFDVFPGLTNPSQKLDQKLMPYYHALCVTGGNFTTLLWAKCSEAFLDIGINSEMIKPYMQKVFANTLADPVKNLTGPLKRKDKMTILNNLNAIEDRKLKNLYQSFVELSQDMEL